MQEILLNTLQITLPKYAFKSHQYTKCIYISSLIWVHSVCWRGFYNTTADDRQITFVISSLKDNEKIETFIISYQSK